MNLPQHVLKAIQDFEKYIKDNNSRFSAWYCGVASDPETRLFSGHGVDRDVDAWAYSPSLYSDQNARLVEDYFLAMGCKGGPGGGDQLTRHAYIYLITSRTRE
jgi:hypothetical protein